MALTLHDTARGSKVDFVPLVESKVSIYCCGLTVQSAPHLGHIRKEVVFDTLRRWLTVLGYEVTLISNVTDIDDKILTKSEQAGLPWYALAYANERELHRAYAALRLQPPTYEPRATGHIPEIIDLIQQIIDRGHAYRGVDGCGDVYFDVRSWPGYGELSGQRLDEMEPAADADPRGKRDPRDFALWKGHKPTEPMTASWESPWGRGRPGWHIECSAMAGKYLGDQFDIHGGGMDLKFPHHENELAQSKAAGRPFARYWLHNAWVTAAGEKMSKSLGNGLLVTEVVKKWPARAVRAYLAGPHYRSMIEFSHTSLDEAATALARVDSFVARAHDRLGEQAGLTDATPHQVLTSVPERFVAAMNDDLGTPAAIGVLYETVREGNRGLESGDDDGVATILTKVEAMLDVFGLRLDGSTWVAQTSGLESVVDGLVQALLDQRQAARARKDYAAADAIRDQLGQLGLTIEDTAQGPRWTR
ncbi:MAG: cysteine--tRNA ligase [Propionibacteriaceae bacterium]|jgi:cysteinyl-tRNA synthetase|nr:cysteine--tRNA ligase [Propionibacteriaceae bacterium]